MSIRLLESQISEGSTHIILPYYPCGEVKRTMQQVCPLKPCRFCFASPHGPVTLKTAKHCNLYQCMMQHLSLHNSAKKKKGISIMCFQSLHWKQFLLETVKHGMSSFWNFRSLFRVHDPKSLPLPLDQDSILSVNKLEHVLNKFPASLWSSVWERPVYYDLQQEVYGTCCVAYYA